MIKLESTSIAPVPLLKFSKLESSENALLANTFFPPPPVAVPSVFEIAVTVKGRRGV
jgi:hypothetical protein